MKWQNSLNNHYKIIYILKKLFLTIFFILTVYSIWIKSRSLIFTLLIKVNYHGTQYENGDMDEWTMG